MRLTGMESTQRSTTSVDPSSGRRRLRFASLVGALLAVTSLLTACLGPVTKLKAIEAVRFPETSDPFVAVDNGKYFMYGSNNHLRAPISTLTSLESAMTLSQKNAVTFEGMPTKPLWTANATQFWAPTVAKFGSRWAMFFSADRVNPPQSWNAQCIGRAWATTPSGPFVPETKAAFCGINGIGGALDPEIFTDKQGRRFLIMALGDTESPIHSIPLDANANLVGKTTAILKRQHPWEYHFIEQPSMIWDPKRDDYVLTYSAGKWWEAAYSIGIARCATPVGPCESDPSGPWVKSSNGRTGPGALSFFRDLQGAPRAIFASFAAGQEGTVGGRSASVYHVKFDPAMALQVVK